MSEAISRPSYLRFHSKFLEHEIQSHSVLVDDIIKIANCLVVFDPPGVSHLKLPRLDQFTHPQLIIRFQGIVPILQKDDFCNEVLALRFG